MPDAEVSVLDDFLATHKTFMDESHPTSGDKEPSRDPHTVHTPTPSAFAQWAADSVHGVWHR